MTSRDTFAPRIASALGAGHARPVTPRRRRLAALRRRLRELAGPLYDPAIRATLLHFGHRVLWAVCVVIAVSAFSTLL